VVTRLRFPAATLAPLLSPTDADQPTTTTDANQPPRLLATPVMGFVFGVYLYVCVCWFHVHYDEAFSALRIQVGMGGSPDPPGHQSHQVAVFNRLDPTNPNQRPPTDPNPQAFKGFTRIHITPKGDLEIWTLGADRVPSAWREDPRWRAPGGGGDRSAPAHAAAVPSRWLPAAEAGVLRRAVARAVAVVTRGARGKGSAAAAAAAAAAGAADQQRQQQAAAAAAAAVLDPSLGFKVVDYLFVPKRRPAGV
jgi:hypothetical protein